MSIYLYMGCVCVCVFGCLQGEPDSKTDRKSLIVNAVSTPASAGESEAFVWGAKMKPLIIAIMVCGVCVCG